MSEENKEPKKFDLKETKEVFDFLNGFISNLAQHKADDGKIDTTEWLQAAIANAPAGAKAVIGLGDVDDELKDLDEAEKMELAGMGVLLAKSLLGLFMGSSSDKE